MSRRLSNQVAQLQRAHLSEIPYNPPALTHSHIAVAMQTLYPLHVTTSNSTQ